MGGMLPLSSVLLSLLILCFISGSIACPDKCDCSQLGSVDCIRVDGFPALDNFPAGTSQITITNSDIPTIANIPDYGSSIENLIIVNSGVTEIEDGAFERLTGLQNLMLNGNKITEITAAKLTGLGNLVELDLGDNLIKNLPNGLLNSLPSLLKLDVSSNKMLLLKEDCFEGSSIVKLDISTCDLGMVDTGIFSKASNLVDLNLDHNPLMKLTKDNFQGLEKLQRLYLADCDLTEVHEDVFDGLEQLQSLDLSFNQLTKLDEDVLDDCKDSLKTLRLQHNNLTTLHHCFMKVETLTVGDNPWDCTCDLGWMSEITMETDDEALCSTPDSVRGRTVSNGTAGLECECGYEGCEDMSHIALYIVIPIVIILVILVVFFVIMIVKNRKEKAKRKSVKYSAVYKDTVESASKPV